ncbi:MAG: GNVR domain-containing protein [candidate division Zixibacteria bacterium]
MYSEEDPGFTENNPSSALTLSQGAVIAFRNRKFVAFVAFASAVVAALMTLLIPNRYTATTTTLPVFSDVKTGGITSLLEASPALEMMNLGADKKSPSLLYPEILKSRLLCDRVLSREYSYTVDGTLRTNNLYVYFDEDNPDLAYDALEKITTIEYDKKTGVVKLSVTTKNPELSAMIANYYIERLDEYNKHSRKSGAMLKRQFIERRMAENKIELAAAEEALKAFRENNRNYIKMTDPQILMVHNRLLREVTVKTEVYRMLAEEYELSAIQEKRETPVIQVLDNAKPPTVKSSPARAKITILAFIAGIFIASGVAISNNLYLPRHRQYDLNRILKKVRFVRRKPEEETVEI